jgi:mannosylglycoprotein endo-beta-mannosidase
MPKHYTPIFQLEQDEGTIVGEENLKVFITEYYKKLFGEPTKNNFHMREDMGADIPQISPEENSILISEFTEDEVFEAISQMEQNKAPGPDGFPAEFYKQFWETIKHDLMSLFAQLQQGDLELFKLNFGVITLIPKKEDVVRIHRYRPICLLNVSFKIFTKVGTDRITGITHKVIKPTQSSFMHAKTRYT